MAEYKPDSSLVFENSMNAHQRFLEHAHSVEQERQHGGAAAAAVASAALGVVDLVLGDLYDLAACIQEASVYDLRKHTLQAWHASMTRSLDMLGRAVRGAIGDSPERKRRQELVMHDDVGVQTESPTSTSAETLKQQQQQKAFKVEMCDRTQQFPPPPSGGGAGGTATGGESTSTGVDKGSESKSPIPLLSKKMVSDLSEVSTNSGRHPHQQPQDQPHKKATIAAAGVAVAGRRSLPTVVSAMISGGGSGSAGAAASVPAATATTEIPAASPHRETPQQQTNNSHPHHNNNHHHPSATTSSSTALQGSSQHHQTLSRNSTIAGAMHLVMDALLATLNCSFLQCFLLSRSKELVLVASVGSRRDQKPGTLRLSSSSGIESLVLSTCVGMNITNAYAENEFNARQDGGGHERTRSQLVFPIVRPAPDGSAYGSQALGVMHACNKHKTDALDLSTGGTVPFTASAAAVFTVEDEHRMAEALHVLGTILQRHPCDLPSLASSLAFDASAMLSKNAREAGTVTGRGIFIQASQRHASVAVPNASTTNNNNNSSSVKFNNHASTIPSPPKAKKLAAGASSQSSNFPLSPKYTELSASYAAIGGLDVVSDAGGTATSNNTVLLMASMVGPIVSFSSNKDGPFCPGGGAGGAAPAAALTVAPPSRRTQLVYRTSKAGHVKRNELLHGAVSLPPVSSITDAVDQVTKINNGWRSSVVLNVELEAELLRHKEQIRALQRENARLHSVAFSAAGALNSHDNSAQLFKD